MTSANNVNQESIEPFLNALFAGKPAEHWIHFFTVKGVSERSDFFATVEEAAAFCRRAQDRNVWVGAGTRSADLGPYERGKAEVVCGIVGLWLDADFGNEGHAKANLPPDETAALNLIAQIGVEPTIIVRSGHGLQPWWLFSDFWTFADGDDHKKADVLTHAFNRRFIAISKAAGFGADNVGDLARILRMPGTYNHKPNCEPVPVSILRADGPRHSIESLRQAFINAKPEPKPVQPPKSVQASKSANDYADPKHWLSRAIEQANGDGTRHDHGVDLACQLRDNCVQSAGLAQCRQAIDAFRVGVDNDPADPYTDSEIRSLYDILTEPPRDPCGIPHHDNNGTEADRPQVQALSDLWNAERLVATHGQNLRYDVDSGRWLVWTGRIWEPDAMGKVERLARRVVKGLYTSLQKEQSGKRAEELFRHIRNSEQMPRLAAMISGARWCDDIPVRSCDLDADSWLISFRNGTLDLKTGERREHRQSDLITRLVNLDYDPTATCPTWEAFLLSVFGNDADLVDFVQRAAGYSLTGDISEQCFFMLHGGGSNGKSTFLTVLREILGDFHRKVSTDTLLDRDSSGIPNDLARLRGARIVTAIEAKPGKKLAETLVKELTGGDAISARFLRQEFFDFVPCFKLWLACNSLPNVDGQDYAIWRRVRLIPFNVEFHEPDAPNGPYMDKLLPAKLRLEYPGIAAWLVRGAMRWQSEGLHCPAAVTAATSQYKEDSDILGQFFADCCVIDPNARVEATELHRYYLTWAQGSGEKYPLSQKTFSMRLGERSYLTRRRTGHNGRWHWFGIGLLNLAEPSEPNSGLFSHEGKDMELTPKCDLMVQHGSADTNSERETESLASPNPAKDDSLSEAIYGKEEGGEGF